MQKNKTQFNPTVRGLIAVGLVATLGIGNANLCATAQSDPYADLADYDLTATWRDKNQQAQHEPDEGREAIIRSIYSREDETGTDQNETQPERRFIIQDDEVPTENEAPTETEDQTNQPRSILQTATDLVTQPLKSLWGWMFGSPKEEN